MTCCRWPLVALAVVFATAGHVLAQNRAAARLLITVVDQSNAVLPGATVTITGLEPATTQTPLAPVRATDAGLATVIGLALGRYRVQAEFPGFEPGVLKEIRLRAGDNRHVVILPIQKLETSVTVSQDVQAGAADRRSGAFGTALTRDQVDALSDDPEEMQRQLQDMAGPGASLRIDSFEGGRLPPKSQIKAIHITRDQFAAESHGAEGLFIDIITQPGAGPIRTFMSYQAHTSNMTARNPLTRARGSDQAQNYGVGINGGLIRNKASFSLNFRGTASFDSPILTAALPEGTRSETLRLTSPRNNQFTSGSFDYAVTPDQTLRLSYNQSDFVNENQGVGGFNLPERAFTSENHTHTLRIQEAGPLGRRWFTNTRLNIGWTDSLSRASVEAPTVRVLDAFTIGGAQVTGGRHSRDVNIASDLDYVRGMHSVRVGTAIDLNWFRSDDNSNYLGTYTFESLDAYNGGRPRSYTKRVGSADLEYRNAQIAFYVQDDIRVSKSLTLTPGLRYEVQSLLDDKANLGPRFGVTWAPFKTGKTTFRASWGLFYDWLQTNTYEQTLRVDGFRQREIQIFNPTYPDLVDVAGSVTPVSRYLLAPDVQNPQNMRASTGVDYSLSPRARVSVTYRYLRGTGILRGENLNAPVGGIRPDPMFGNVIQVVSDGSSRQHMLQFNGQSPPPTPAANQPAWSWKRVGFYSNYTWTSNRNNSDGPFTPPATGSLAREWGHATGLVRHRANAGISSSQLRGAFVGVDGTVSSGMPYTIQTGLDDNGDLIFNDRPSGVARNSARASTQWWINLNAGYSFTFGPRVILPGGPMIYGGPSGVTVSTFTPPAQGRYRLGFNVFVQNLTNRANFVGYSGVLTSPLFGQPISAINPRRVNIGVNFGF